MARPRARRRETRCGRVGARASGRRGAVRAPRTPAGPVPPPAGRSPRRRPPRVGSPPPGGRATAVRVREPVVEHARAREQFGRPVGAFGAVRHLCADLLTRAGTARAAVYTAAATADPAGPAAARLLAGESAVRGARTVSGWAATWASPGKPRVAGTRRVRSCARPVCSADRAAARPERPRGQSVGLRCRGSWRPDITER
ncbi:acyl-CoA dehydrogenase family protein [Streptomyces misionensis]|uniref:acyl-CoA dehydrogenase family protein n=1 Tax=Streptomyces misionensis TaxID=67331 RepID=UPI0037DA4710